MCSPRNSITLTAFEIFRFFAYLWPAIAFDDSICAVFETFTVDKPPQFVQEKLDTKRFAVTAGSPNQLE